METSGIKKQVLILVEKLTYFYADFVYPNSFALKEYIQQNKFTSPEKLRVIANGTSNGIDTGYFRRTDEILEQAEKLRIDFGIPPTDKIFSIPCRWR